MKKVLSVLVVLSMLLSILPATVSATHWAEEDVKYLIENGAIAEDDTMLNTLDTPITRSQMVKIIVALLQGDEPIEGKEYFTDITADDTHIAKAAENGIVNGFGDGTFRPNNPITRQDFFTIVGRAYKLEGEATNEFTDADSIADYAKPHVDALQSIGIVNGYGDGAVNPRDNITIAETLAVMCRTDEHIKANTPTEEEKPKPSSGGGGFFNGSNIGDNSSSDSDDESSDDNNSDVTPPYFPYATFSIELEDDFTGDYVAQVTANIITANNIPPKKTLVVVDGGLRPTGAVGSFKPWEVAQEKNQYIAEVDGKFFVPDFGQYELYIIEEDDTVSEFAFDVIPPKSNDKESPKLDIEVVGDETLPVTFKTTVSDNTQIARLDYVKESNLGLGGTMLDENKNYMIYVNGRIPIVDNSFTISEYGNYIVCAMDIHGNYTFRYINVSSKKLSISDSCQVYSFDDFTPEIETSHSVLNEKLSGPIEIPLTPFDISPFTNPTVVDAGYFFIEECYLTEPLYTNLFPRRVYLKSRYAIDLSKDIDYLKQYESLCGGAGSMSLLKNYYEATKDGSGIEIVPISKNEATTISLTKNGIYFAYAKDADGNLAVVVLNLNHIKTASATFEVEHDEDTSSDYVAHVTATVDANPNAPVTQMFAVKSDYEPESAGAYREYTPNGKAQKIWDEVSVSGEYISVEEAKFSVSEYGTYSLYMLDEYGNWGTSEVEVTAPEADDVTPNP